MDKKILISIFVISLSVFASSNILAITPTPNNLEKINDLKERVASKVAELRATKITILSGGIKSRSEDSFVLITSSGEKTISVGQDTKYYWASSAGKILKIGFSNLEKGDNFTVKTEGEDEGAIATILIGKDQTFTLIGTVTFIDNVNRNIKLSIKKNDKPLSIAVEKTTVISAISDKGTLDLGKFSDISENSSVFIRGRYTDNTRKEISAKRIIIIKSPKPTS